MLTTRCFFMIAWCSCMTSLNSQVSTCKIILCHCCGRPLQSQGAISELLSRAPTPTEKRPSTPRAALDDAPVDSLPDQSNLILKEPATRFPASKAGGRAADPKLLRGAASRPCILPSTDLVFGPPPWRHPQLPRCPP
jgi:hypothetical protein